MISKTLQDKINEQINKELYSEYLYLSMAAYCDSIGMPGFANFFKVQVEEERFHAMKMFNYVNERGGRVILKAIDCPQTEFKSILEVMELTYEHEQYVTKLINDLMAAAIEEKDFATMSFLNWYIDEQVEEEATMDNLVNQLKLIDGKGQGLLMLDKELAGRTFNPPTK